MSAYETRKRDFELRNEHNLQTTDRSFDGGATWSHSESPSDSLFVNREELTSRENERWLYQQHVRNNPAKYRSTSPFYTGTKSYFLTSDSGGKFDQLVHRYNDNSQYSDHELVVNPFRRHMYRGRFYPRYSTAGPTSAAWPDVPWLSDANLNALGATAIKLTLPTNPTANLAAALGELRNDGLPAIPTKAILQAALKDLKVAKVAASLGSEYLNIVFGWKPFMSDVRKAALAVRKSNKLIEQFTRDSGRPIRRRFSFPTVRNVTTTVLSDNGVITPLPSLDPIWYTQPRGTLVKTRVEVIQTWFSACYTYHLDPGKTALGRARRHEQIANKLLGTRINPEVLWELTPWSWAADWLANTGDVITNISALSTDSLVIRWAYIMREHRIVDTYTLTGPSIKGGPASPFVQSFTTVVKQRRRATPYGFGLQYTGFTNRQMAIIAALGLSRTG